MAVKVKGSIFDVLEGYCGVWFSCLKNSGFAQLYFVSRSEEVGNLYKFAS